LGEPYPIIIHRIYQQLSVALQKSVAHSLLMRGPSLSISDVGNEVAVHEKEQVIDKFITEIMDNMDVGKGKEKVDEINIRENADDDVIVKQLEMVNVEVQKIRRLTKRKICTGEPRLTELKKRKNNNCSEPQRKKIKKNDFYVEKKILEEKLHNGKIKYLVKWEGFDEGENSWIREDQFGEGSMLRRWKTRHLKTKPKKRRLAKRKPLVETVSD